MFLALTIAGTSSVLFVFFSWFFNKEQKNGKRFFLPNFRSIVDSLLVASATAVHRFFVYIIKYVITLSWYYSLHAFLQLTLKSLAGFYYMVERVTHANRDRARKIRHERKLSKSHLDVLVDHKDGTKLTEQQKKRLKDKAINAK